MSKIWFFGDSFTDTNVERIGWKLKYDHYKKYTTKHYTEILCEKLNMDYENHAIGGIDNETILECLIDNMNKIGDEDLIIVNWSSTYRFRVYSDISKKFVVLTPKSNTNLSGIDDECMDKLLIKRETNLHVEQILKWTRLLKKTFGNKIFFWSPFSEYKETEIITLLNTDPLYKLDYDKYKKMGVTFSETGRLKKSYLSIYGETDGKVDDGHYGEIGNYFIADLLLYNIEKQKI